MYAEEMRDAGATDSKVNPRWGRGLEVFGGWLVVGVGVCGVGGLRKEGLATRQQPLTRESSSASFSSTARWAIRSDAEIELDLNDEERRSDRMKVNILPAISLPLEDGWIW
ncbi:hypothetical protein DL95DRAFT_75065 [Leptodontidium sp. 2 PMI_412]|nr:hypothetical protein DL95DRAFT_75065 [Leptodontidium sp. 2 PMI_412]